MYNYKKVYTFSICFRFPFPFNLQTFNASSFIYKYYIEIDTFPSYYRHLLSSTDTFSAPDSLLFYTVYTHIFDYLFINYLSLLSTDYSLLSTL